MTEIVNPDKTQKSDQQEKIIELLRTVPIIEVVCRRVPISRATVYRWLDKEPLFKARFNEALSEGEEFISDKSESQIINLIGDKHFPAIKHWLAHHREKYMSEKSRKESDKKVRIIILHDHED